MKEGGAGGNGGGAKEGEVSLLVCSRGSSLAGSDVTSNSLVAVVDLSTLVVSLYHFCKWKIHAVVRNEKSS